MKKLLILSTTTVVALIGAGCAEQGWWIASLACIGWEVFVLWANTKKKPRRAGRSKEDVVPMKPLYTYDITVSQWTQDPEERWRA